MSESALDISPGCKDKRGRADVSVLVLAGNALVPDQGLLLSIYSIFYCGYD
jgi:hypothetical protein